MARSGRQHVMAWLDGFDIWRQKNLYREANRHSAQKMCARAQGGAIPTANSTLRGQGLIGGERGNREQGAIDCDDPHLAACGQRLLATDTPDRIIQLDAAAALLHRLE